MESMQVDLKVEHLSRHSEVEEETIYADNDRTIQILINLITWIFQNS